MKSIQSSSLTLRTKKLKFEKSSIHSFGVFAQERILENEMVVEYIGEYISNEIADIRQSIYYEYGYDDYMFRANDAEVIDATLQGNIAR